MSPRSTPPSAAPIPPDHSAGTRLLADSPALQDFSSAHRAGSMLVDDRARTDEAALVDLAITFGIIGAEFLAAVVEFLQIHQRCIETTAARQEQLASATRHADATYTACDCAAADREFTL
ncbi:type VII secretion target [Gordonia westfalica]|nr:type VII secretion target [Gordonia westfalica]